MMTFKQRLEYAKHVLEDDRNLRRNGYGRKWEHNEYRWNPYYKDVTDTGLWIMLFAHEAKFYIGLAAFVLFAYDEDLWDTF